MVIILQSVAVFGAAGMALLTSIAILRWTASLEARLRRIDSFLARVDDAVVSEA